jgi:luciferase family oxidoreductase group 1
MTSAGSAFDLGILDLGSPKHAFMMATRAEELGYSRYWLPEHHGATAQSGSPTVLTTLIAGMTERIRVGPAGILLNYNSPLKVAEDYRVLSMIFPGRIDLGIARGTTTGVTHEALRDGRSNDGQDYDARVELLAGLARDDFPSSHPGFEIKAVPPLEGEPPELWVLGASTRSVGVAARLGASFCFSEHLAVMNREADPEIGVRAVEQYRASFVPSRHQATPCWSVCIAGVCAESEKAAREAMRHAPPEFRGTLMGTSRQCLEQLHALEERYGTREFIFADLALASAEAKLRSYELLAEACGLAA